MILTTKMMTTVSITPITTLTTEAAREQYEIIYITEQSPTWYYHVHHLVGLVVKVSASRAEDTGFESRLRRDFSGVE